MISGALDAKLYSEIHQDVTYVLCNVCLLRFNQKKFNVPESCGIEGIPEVSYRNNK